MQAVKARITTLSSKTTAAAALHSPHSKKVFADTSNVIHPWLGRSFVAHDSSEPCRRSGVRMHKDERRVLVKDFVDKYRALNAGKFPTPSEAQREVGGSYYIIKNIVQELEYNSKRPSTDTSKMDEVSLEELVKEESLAAVEPTVPPCSKTKADLTYSAKNLGRKDEPQSVVANNMDMDEVSSTSNNFEAKKETPDSFEILSSEDVPSAKTIDDPSNFDEKHIHQVDVESKKTSHLGNGDPANCEKKASTPDGYEPKLVQVALEEVIELDKLENKGVSVSHLCIEDPNDSKKKTATSDGSIDLKEPQIVTETAQETYESYNLGNKLVPDLFTEDRKNSNEKSTISEGNKSKVGLGEMQEPYESEKLESPRDVSRKENELRLPNKSTLWGNLRSFAEGVISLWKKL